MKDSFGKHATRRAINFIFFSLKTVLPKSVPLELPAVPALSQNPVLVQDQIHERADDKEQVHNHLQSVFVADDRKPRGFGAVLQIFHGDGIGQVLALVPEPKALGVLARVGNAVNRVGVEISSRVGYEVVPYGANLGTHALGGLAMNEPLVFPEILDCRVYRKHNDRDKYYVVQIC